MAEWRNGGWNGRMADGMTEWRNGGWNGGMVEWREWLNGENGGNGGNGGTAERMAERQNGRSGYIRTIYGTRRHNGGMACGMVEWLIGGNGRMAGMVGMAGMAERQKEWQNGSGYIRTIYGTRRHRQRHQQRRHLNLL